MGLNKSNSVISTPDVSTLFSLRVDRNTVLFFSTKEKMEAAKVRFACGSKSATRELRWNVNNKPITRQERKLKKAQLAAKNVGAKFQFRNRKIVALPNESKLDAIHRNLLSKTTKYEKLMSRFLDNCGIENVIQKRIGVSKKTYFLDIYVPKARVAIEVDGGYHSTPETKADDAIRDKHLLSIGIKTFRILNKDVSCPRRRLEVLAFITQHTTHDS